MATEASLNQIVKGAPRPDTKLPGIKPLPPLVNASNEVVSHEFGVTKTPRGSRKDSVSTTDPALSALPSSPPQIYLNLLILEASLRSQYLHLLSRRRINTFFLLLLVGWNGFFIWALFLRPREDGQGLGGSVYWVVETCERLACMGGIVTILLVKATGQWERGIRWPRRWLGTTNRGLRGFNLRVVIAKGTWYRETLGHFAFLLPFGFWPGGGGSNWQYVEHENGHIVEEDLAKGGDHIMLLLLPKNFSSEFRENWETYRAEYWERENQHRQMLKKKMKQRQRNKARELGGWKWWTGLWRLSGSTLGPRRPHDLEKHPHQRHHHGLSEKDALAKATRRRSVIRNGSHSRQSSRSSTPHLTQADMDGHTDLKPLSERVRRGSSVSSTSSLRRNTKGRDRRTDGMLSPLTAADDEGVKEKEKKTRKKDRNGDTTSGSRPTTPKRESMELASPPA